MKNKTHFRKVFKSDHLGVADLEEYLEEGVTLIFTIKQVKQEINVAVAGRRGNHNIAYFKEGIKPLVLNATNSKVLKSFNGNSPFIEDWGNTLVELHIDHTVTMKGERVGGVRISKVQPKPITAKPEFTEANFEKAFEAGADIERVKQVYRVSKEIEKKYLEYGTKK